MFASLDWTELYTGQSHTAHSVAHWLGWEVLDATSDKGLCRSRSAWGKLPLDAPGRGAPQLCSGERQ